MNFLGLYAQEDFIYFGVLFLSLKHGILTPFLYDYLPEKTLFHECAEVSLKTTLIWFYAPCITFMHKDSVTSTPAFAFQKAYENHL
jgi:hypothetical protein